MQVGTHCLTKQSTQSAQHAIPSDAATECARGTCTKTTACHKENPKLHGLHGCTEGTPHTPAATAAPTLFIRTPARGTPSTRAATATMPVKDDECS